MPELPHLNLQAAIQSMTAAQTAIRDAADDARREDEAREPFPLNAGATNPTPPTQ